MKTVKVDSLGTFERFHFLKFFSNARPPDACYLGGEYSR